MADKKLNEVTTVNSGTLAKVKNFLAVMNDGSIQQMSKADLASVVGGLIGTADMVKSGLMDKNIISKLITKSTGANQQITVIRSTGINPYYSGLVSVYKGGVNFLYSITISKEKPSIKKLSAHTEPSPSFYLNSNKDLIIKSASNITTMRVRLLLLDSANVDFSGCMVDNSDSDLQEVEIS